MIYTLTVEKPQKTLNLNYDDKSIQTQSFAQTQNLKHESTRYTDNKNLKIDGNLAKHLKEDHTSFKINN